MGIMSWMLCFVKIRPSLSCRSYGFVVITLQTLRFVIDLLSYCYYYEISDGLMI